MHITSESQTRSFTSSPSWITSNCESFPRTEKRNRNKEKETAWTQTDSEPPMLTDNFGVHTEQEIIFEKYVTDDREHINEDQR